MLSGASSILHCLGRGWDTPDLWLSTARTNPFLVAVWVATLWTNSIAGPKTRPRCLIVTVSASAFTHSNLEDTDFQPIFQLKTTVSHWVIAWGRRSSKSSGVFPHRPTSTYFQGPQLWETPISNKRNVKGSSSLIIRKKKVKNDESQNWSENLQENPLRLSGNLINPTSQFHLGIPTELGRCFASAIRSWGPVFGTTRCQRCWCVVFTNDWG